MIKKIFILLFIVFSAGHSQQIFISQVKGLQDSLNNKIGGSSGSSGVPVTRTLTINSQTYDLSANRSWSVGTIVASDTTLLHNEIVGRLLIGDTTGIRTYTNNQLALKLNIVDTIGLQFYNTNRLALKLNFSDTASMLSPYLRTSLLAVDTAINSTWSWNGSTLKIPMLNIPRLDKANTFTQTNTFDTVRVKRLSLGTGTDSTASTIYKDNVRFIHTFTPYNAINAGNLFFGPNAGNFTMIGGIGGSASELIGIGRNVLQSTTTGFDDVGIGAYALASLTSGSYNIAIGPNALSYDTSGIHNIGIGYKALWLSPRGSWNIAIGSYTLDSLTGNAGDNISIGSSAGAGMTSGGANVIVGGNAGNYLTTSAGNVLIGMNTMFFNRTGSYNVVAGFNSGYGSAFANNQSYDVFIGDSVASSIGASANYNVGVGSQSLKNLTTGGSNVVLGANAGAAITSGGANIIIGNGSNRIGFNGSNQINIGDAIYGTRNSTPLTSVSYANQINTTGNLNAWAIMSRWQTKVTFDSLGNSYQLGGSRIGGATDNGYTFHAKAKGYFDSALVVGGGSPISKIVTASLVYDCGSIAADVDSIITVTATGAVAGNPVSWGVSVAPETGLQIEAYCVTNDVVKIVLHNGNSDLLPAIDPASRTYKILVVNF